MRKHCFAGVEIEKLFKSSLRLTTVMTAVVLLLVSCGFSAETSEVLSKDLQTLKDDVADLGSGIYSAVKDSQTGQSSESEPVEDGAVVENGSTENISPDRPHEEPQPEETESILTADIGHDSADEEIHDAGLPVGMEKIEGIVPVVSGMVFEDAGKPEAEKESPAALETVTPADSGSSVILLSNPEQVELQATLNAALPLETALEAVRVALTNCEAMDVFTDDGMGFAPSKFHGSDYNGQYAFTVKDEGTWSADSSWAWKAENILLVKPSFDRAARISCKVTCDGQNYIVYNVTYVTAKTEYVDSGDPSKTSGEMTMEPGDYNPFLTIPTHLVTASAGKPSESTLMLAISDDEQPVDMEINRNPVWQAEPEQPDSSLQIWEQPSEQTGSSWQAWEPADESQQTWEQTREPIWQEDDSAIYTIEDQPADQYWEPAPPADLLMDWYPSVPQYDDNWREIYFVNMETGKIHHQRCRYCDWGKYDWPVALTVYPDELIASAPYTYSYCQVCCKGR